MRLANFKWACFNRFFFFYLFFSLPLLNPICFTYTPWQKVITSLGNSKEPVFMPASFIFFSFVCFLEKEFDHSLEITANYHFPPSPVQSKLDKLKQGLEAEATWLQI